ncbi:MAG: chemotaxis protein CheZ [Alphaproteobacteria bacterium]|nr:chemotaxis protein CheZ [Alphaproteobacteria bacterium]
MPRDANATGTELQKRIMDAVAKGKEPIARAEVAKIVEQVMKSFIGDQPGADARMVHEIEDLARFIRNAKQEVAAIRPKEIGDKHIPTATVELDAVVGATEDATNKIMDECDKIGLIAGGLEGDPGTQLTECVTRIFEACNFQDITGQRITKVVNALKHIENKVEALLKALGHDGSDAPAGEDDDEAILDPHKALLNGPQLPESAVSQDDIDKLMGS